MCLYMYMNICVYTNMMYAHECQCTYMYVHKIYIILYIWYYSHVNTIDILKLS